MARRSSDAPADALPRCGLADPKKMDAAKPKRHRKVRHRDDPPADMIAWKAGAEKRIRTRPMHPMIMLEPAGFDREHMVPLHNDERLHDLQLAEAFGTRSRSVIYTFMSQLEALCSEKWWDEEAHQWRLNEHTFNTVLTLVSAIKPRNEMEAALAAQMAAVHLLTMKVTARAIKYDADTRTAATAGKLARTFAMQMETLQGLRGKRRTTRQSIKVTKELHQHVHYHDHRGDEESDCQPHGAAGGAIVECAEVQSQEPRGQVVPLPSRSR
jgi:hypothetical protein